MKNVIDPTSGKHAATVVSEIERHVIGKVVRNITPACLDCIDKNAVDLHDNLNNSLFNFFRSYERAQVSELRNR